MNREAWIVSQVGLQLGGRVAIVISAIIRKTHLQQQKNAQFRLQHLRKPYML